MTNEDLYRNEKNKEMESPTLDPTANVVRPPSTLPFVHRYYLLLKAHYFLYFAAFGALYPILSITLRSRGLSNTELSYINAIIPFLVFFTNPLMCFLADRSRRYLSTFNCLVVIVTIIYSIIFILPPVKSQNIQGDMYYDDTLGRVLDFCASQEVATKCASRSECGCSYQANCTLLDQGNYNQMNSYFFTFSMNSTDINKEIKGTAGISEPAVCGIEYRVPVDRAIKHHKNNRSFDPFPKPNSPSRMAVCEITCSIAHYCHGPRYPNQMRFIVLYSLLFVIGTNFLTNAIPIGAAIGFATIDSPDIFGQQRVWGTIGFGIFAFTASRLYGIFQTEFVYIIMFAIITVICMIITSFIRIQPNKRNRSLTLDENNVQNADDLAVIKKKSPSRIAALFPLLKEIDVIVFLTLAFIWGMSYAVLDPFLFLYIDEIAPCQSRSIVGYMSLVSAMAEVIALFLAGRVIKFLGANISSIIILLAFTIRFAGYYYIRQPYYLICMESMHFFNFGILYVLILQKADAIAPPGLSGTLQGVALGILFGFGKGVGLLVSSFIYTLIEQRLLFLIFAIFNFIVAVLYCLYFLLNRQRSKKSIEDNNVPKIVIESDAKLNEEPLLMSSTVNKSDNQINKQ